MKDIVDKVDRAKELVALARTDMPREQEEAAAAELLDLGVDALGELVVNSRRTAVALEKIAENTAPVKLEAATAELAAFQVDPDVLRTMVNGLLVEHGLVSPHNPRVGA